MSFIALQPANLVHPRRKGWKPGFVPANGSSIGAQTVVEFVD